MTSINPEGETTIGWSHYVYPESKLLDAVCVIADTASLRSSTFGTEHPAAIGPTS